MINLSAGGSALSFSRAIFESQLLAHNLPEGRYFIQFLTGVDGFDTGFLAVGGSFRIWLNEIDQSASYKLLAFKISNGIADGVWWVDNYVYSAGQVNIEFTSQGGQAGDGEAGSFSGSVLVAGQLVARTVLATALDADVPYLLAQGVSDPVTGQYSLSWNGYTGKMLVTVLDDYGVGFVDGDARGVGERIHPTEPNGYVYQVSNSGVLGAEPDWPVSDGAPVASGTVQLVAIPFYQPQSQGPFSV